MKYGVLVYNTSQTGLFSILENLSSSDLEVFTMLGKPLSTMSPDLILSVLQL